MNNKIKIIITKFILFLWDDRFKFEENLEISRKLMMLNYVVIACVVFLVPFGVLSFLNSDYMVALSDLFAALVIFSAIVYYKKTLNYIFLSYVIIIVLGILFLFLLFSAGSDYSGPLWSYIFPISVMFMLGKKRAVIFVVLYLMISVILLFLAPSSNIYSLSFKLRFIGSFSAASVISYYVEYVRETMHRLLHEKNIDLKNSLNKLEKQEKALAEKELHFRTLFEASNDSIFLMDGEYFTECNPRTLEMFGCKRDDIINQSPVKFSPINQPDGKPSSEKAIEKISAVLNGRSQFFEWVHCKLDGTTFFAEVSLVLVEVDQNKLIQASVRDITSRKIAEKELIIAKNRAEKSDRLKSDFLAQMSHEIRTPINTIMNYTSLLKMEFEDKASEDNASSFKSIENAAIRLLRTIDLILNISDLESGTYDPKFEKNNLEGHIVLPVVNEFRQAAENKNLFLGFKSDLTEDPITILDNYTVYQTIANLVDNAIKYTETGNIVVVLEKENSDYILKIEDTGVGISKEYIPKLFDKFSQEDAGYTRRYEGSGLGLALVKKYCEINQIDISVESQKGIGTIFILKIPILELT